MREKSQQIFLKTTIYSWKQWAEVNGKWASPFSSVFVWLKIHTLDINLLIFSNIEYYKTNLQKLPTNCLEIGIQGQTVHLEHNSW